MHLFLTLFLVAAFVATSALANTIAVVVMMGAPFALRYVKLDGPTMVLVSYGVAVVVTLAAAFGSGEVKVSDLNASNVTQLVVLSGGLWSVSQGIFQLFKDHKTFGVLLTGKPSPPLPPAV